MTTNPVLVEVLRGGHVESWHRAAVAVVDADGGLVAALGDVDRPVYPRSAVKPLQALPLVAAGAAERFGFGDDELALACASHNGEPVHVRTAQAMLAKAGLDADVLECGVHWPYHEGTHRAMAAAGESPGALHNNCSGKHAGFVCVGCLLAAASGVEPRAFLRGYVRAEHPVMQEVTAALQAATGFDPATAPMGVDGCAIPTWGIAPRALALGFARLATGRGLDATHAQAARRLRAAMAAAPYLVGGAERFDTLVMQRLGERVCCKAGAEGVHCAALPTLGLGVAVKVDDGATRAASALMAATVAALLDLDADERAFVDALAAPPVPNRHGTAVGGLRVVQTPTRAR